MKTDTLIENIETKFDENRLSIWDLVENLQTTTVRTVDLAGEIMNRDVLTPIDVLIMDVITADGVVGWV